MNGGALPAKSEPWCNNGFFCEMPAPKFLSLLLTKQGYLPRLLTNTFLKYSILTGTLKIFHFLSLTNSK